MEEIKKTEVDVYEGMGYLLEVITSVTFCRMLGVGPSWLSFKQRNYRLEKGYVYHYTYEDVDRLNAVLPLVADEIERRCLIPDELAAGGDAVSEFIRHTTDGFITIQNLATKRMGKSLTWIKSRMDVARNSRRNTCKFTPEDVKEFNKNYKELIIYLRGVHLLYSPAKRTE